MNEHDAPSSGRTGSDAEESALLGLGSRVPTPSWSEPSSLAHRVLRGRIRGALLGEEAESVRVDRFVLERELGRGGMGTVWRARDEQLDRSVALKFLRHADDGEVAERRLFVEAQGLAKISHPNVVPVFDVGRHQGRVWIAMELVPGRTLRAWAEEDSPTFRHRLDAWLDAGRGLAAVHAAGLVHRDIKPDNVMMGDDGRVRLVDFGLVRATGVEAWSEAESTLSRSIDGSGSGSAGTPLTPTRGFVGTPAYAAPEQRGGRADARADQYSFCASMWEALVGRRPSIDDAPQRPGQLVELAPGERMPARIRRALSRGLCWDRDHRFASMDELLDALEPLDRRWIPPVVLGTALVATFGAALMGAFDSGAVAADPCEQSGAAVEQLWSESRRARLQDRVGETSPLVITALDQWHDAWDGAARQACSEVHVERSRSESSLDPRRACLDRALRELDVLLTELEEVDEGAPTMAKIAALARPEGCLHEHVLASGADALEPEERGMVRELRARMASVRLDIGGSTSSRASEARMVFDEAARAELLDVEAEAARLLAGLATLEGEPDEVERWAGIAIDLGERTANPSVLAGAWYELGVGALQLELDRRRGRWAAERARSALESIPSDVRSEALVLQLEAQLLTARGEPDAAERAARRAVERLAGAGPREAWHHATALRTLAFLLAERGHRDEVDRLLAQATVLEQGRANDARVATEAGEVRMNEGLALFEAGRLDDAARSLTEALEIFVREGGPRSHAVGRAHLNLAALADARGDLAALVHHAHKADAIFVVSGGPLHFDRTYPLNALATAAFREGRFDDAAAGYQRVLLLSEGVLPPRSAELAIARMNLGEARLAQGREQEAEVALHRALDVLEQTRGPDDADTAIARKALGTVLLSRGDVEGAHAHAEASVRGLAADGSSPVELAQARWLLARTTRALGREDDALAEAHRALAELEALGPAWREQADELREWIELRPSEP